MNMLAEKIQLENDEHILIQVRKHWFVFGVQILLVIVMAFLPAILSTLLVNSPLFEKLSVHISTTSLVIFNACWLILSWMALFSVWTNYYLDVWTITSKRLIAVDQRGLFNRNTGSFRLERLQDINVSIRGIIPTFLDYGNLEAETASNDKEFVAHSIPHPQELKALIMSAADNITYNGGNVRQHGVEV